MDVKVGDVVHVRGVVTHEIGLTQDDPTSLFTVGFEDCTSARVWGSEIIHVEPAPPKPLQVGDRVTHKGKQVGTLRAINGDYVWVDVDNFAPMTWRLRNTTRI